jgi:hypothetical protein
MYKLSFKLKQHTPIIHFQHDQERATLRGSELKPKLDKFIIEEFGGKSNLQKEHPDWFISKDHPALNYKVKIINRDENQEKGTVEIMPDNVENWVMSKEIVFELFTLNSSLLDNTKRIIHLFFAVTNFGKRQSKGFGCFFPDTLKEVELVELIRNSNISIYKSNQIINGNSQSSDFYSKIISKKWSEFKSGINSFWLKNPIYIKSQVFNYLESENLRWDKRWIKRQINDLIRKGQLPNKLKQQKHDPIDIDSINSWDDKTNEEYRFGRAMLGLAEHYEFLTDDNNIKYKVNVKQDEIDRFQSPVLFKVFDSSIYAITNEIPSTMFDATFNFEVQKKRKWNNKFHDDGPPVLISDTLKTPDKKEFILTDLLDNHFNSIGFKKM